MWDVLSGLVKSGWDALPDLSSLYSGDSDKGLGWLSALATGASVGSNVYNAVGANNAMDQYQKLAKRPINPYEFYQQMSEAERLAINRQTKADMATRGIPADGGYGTALGAEIMAGKESERFNNALQAALNQRQLQLGGYGNVARLAQGMPGVGDSNAMGNFMRWRAAKMGRQQGQQTPTPGAANSQPGAVQNWGPYAAGDGWGSSDSVQQALRGSTGTGMNPYSAGGDVYPSQSQGAYAYDDY